MRITDLLWEGEKLLYRGITPRNLPRRYPGTYYTESPELAKMYAKGGKVLVRHGAPRNPLNIDQLLRWNPTKKQEFLGWLVAFINENYPSVEIEDTQLYDNLGPNPPTDFSYPIQADVDFLISLGYDSVYFSTEGGEKVNTWFVFDEK